MFALNNRDATFTRFHQSYYSFTGNI